MNEHDDAGLPAADLRRDGDPGHLVIEEPTPAKRPRRRAAAFGIAAAVLLTAGAGAGAWAAVAQSPAPSSTSANGTQGWPGGTGQGGTTQGGTTQGGTGQGGPGSGQGFGSQGGTGSQGGFGSQGGTGGSATSSSGTAATAAQSVGVVTVVSELGYQSGESAGTGIVLTSSGRILTNNHVIDGATAVQVTIGTTGRSYAAQVVGTNATEDVAVLQLEDASGLATADLADSTVAIGDEVTAVGNAGGTGTLAAADGTVTATDEEITTSSEGSAEGETLRGLIETDAEVVSGDSGGPLKNADGEVVGIDTAATSGASEVRGYAIPIDDALAVAKQIVAGEDTDEITIGLPAFLGVSLDPDSDDATIAQVLQGTAAADSDLAAGDTITAVDGTAVSSADDLTAAIGTHAPGDSIRLAYTDEDGDAQTAVVVLAEGPAD